jgi:enoyl-CoA hydratase
VAFGTDFVRYERRGGAGWLHFDRPASRNALTIPMYEAVVQACAEVDADPRVQVLVLTGVGDAFSAGGDMKLSHGITEGVADGPAGIGAFRVLGNGPAALIKNDPILAIQRARKLVVAAVNGVCQGGAFIMAMVADLTIASELATFRVPEPLHGLADPWVASRLPLYVGMERAKRIMFQCSNFSAEQALEWGFVSEVVLHENLEDRAAALVSEILRTGPAAREAYKAAANRLLPDHPPNHPDFEDVNRVLQSDEGREGLLAFKEKRAPGWVTELHVGADGANSRAGG